MPIAGAKPKPDGQKRHRVAPVHDWTEVVNIPYTEGPELPGRWGKAVNSWWEVIRAMPHCVLWTPGDWQYAFETAAIANKFFRDKTLGASRELRDRERKMGMTLDDRRDLRIRYVEPSQGEEETGVTSLADYRASIE